jgi:hypothetical protein
MNERSQTTYSSVTRLTMNALLVQGLLALRPTLADSLPLSPVESITPWPFFDILNLDSPLCSSYRACPFWN